MLPVCTSEEKKKEKISISSIDNLFSAPDKIEIPSRYQPEVERTLMSMADQESRNLKATSIKKMLVETGPSCSLPTQGRFLSLLEPCTISVYIYANFQIATIQLILGRRMRGPKY